MTDHDRERERELELDEEGRPSRVKFTDKRRVHADEAADAPQPPVVEPDRRVLGVAERADAELEQAKRQAAEYLDHLPRLQAEFAKYKKRVRKEQTCAIDVAVQP